MSGIDFVDTIVVRSTGKGTDVIVEPLKSMKWAGTDFKKEQEAKLRKMGNLTIESAKGTSRINLGKMGRTLMPNVQGHYISTGKGTGLLKL